MPGTADDQPFRILALDGGGSKGAYTLGVLAYIEQELISEPLAGKFQLVYGTSTGSIIGSMLALGHDVQTIWRQYQSLVPEIMGTRRPRKRSARLRKLAHAIYRDELFDSFTTRVAIVTVNLDLNGPLIFKSHQDQLLRPPTNSTFVPGFGAKISDAVVASCSARPFFEPHTVDLGVFGTRTLVDGGHMANNPMPLALLETDHALKVARSRIRVLSVGTGDFAVRRGLMLGMLYRSFGAVRHLSELMDTSTKTMEWLNGVLFRGVHSERVSNTHKDICTNFLDPNVGRLEEIYSRGVQDAEKAENANGALTALLL